MSIKGQYRRYVSPVGHGSPPRPQIRPVDVDVFNNRSADRFDPEPLTVDEFMQVRANRAWWASQQLSRMLPPYVPLPRQV